MGVFQDAALVAAAADVDKSSSSRASHLAVISKKYLLSFFRYVGMWMMASDLDETRT